MGEVKHFYISQLKINNSVDIKSFCSFMLFSSSRLLFLDKSLVEKFSQSVSISQGGFKSVCEGRRGVG